jgi:hypothetical protein
MSKYFGDIAENETIHIPFNTYNSSGASVTFTGTTIKVYKDNATATEVTTGVTLSKDHDGITGAHLVTIVTTDAFYATGSDYSVMLQAATIDSQTVNSVIGEFSIENRYMRGTDSAALATTLNTKIPNNLNTTASGNIGIDWANVENPTTALDLSGTDIQLVDTASTVTDGAKDATVAKEATLNTKVPNALNTTASGNIGIDWANVENPTTALDLSGTDIQLVDTATTVTGGATQNKLLRYTQLVLRKDAAITSDNVIEASEINADMGSGAGNYSNQLESQEAIRDRGDAAWTTATSSDVTGADVNVASMDANTVTASALAADAVDEIWAKAMSDLAQGAPSATASVLTAMNYLYEAWRNKTTTTSTTLTVFKDDGTTELVKSTISDDGTTFTKGEMASGA